MQNIDFNKLSGDSHQPLNDISNQFNSKSIISSLNSQLNKNIKQSDDQLYMDEQKDDVADLENMLFGPNPPADPPVNLALNHNMVKHALEVDATCTNLIGDRSKKHVLPVINGKHQDLQCIAPETVRLDFNKFFNWLKFNAKLLD